MDISALAPLVQFYCEQGTTCSAYDTATRHYLQFCHQCKVANPFSLVEEVLCTFVAQLAHQGLKHSTVKPRLPITPTILRCLRGAWALDSSCPDSLMLWAACCIAFFGFLWAAEFTVPSLRKFDPGAHLTYRDIAVDSHAKPSTMRVTIKQSKTDPFHQGIHIFLARVHGDLCPVEAMMCYLEARGDKSGPLFCCTDGSPLSRPRLVKELRLAVQASEIDPAPYSVHSFCIGQQLREAQRIQSSKHWEDGKAQHTCAM